MHIVLSRCDVTWSDLKSQGRVSLWRHVFLRCHVTFSPDRPPTIRHIHVNSNFINPLNPELNPICYLLALLAHHFLHVSRIRVKSLTISLLMSYIYIYIYDISNLRVKTRVTSFIWLSLMCLNTISVSIVSN